MVQCSKLTGCVIIDLKVSYLLPSSQQMCDGVFVAAELSMCGLSDECRNVIELNNVVAWRSKASHARTHTRTNTNPITVQQIFPLLFCREVTAVLSASHSILLSHYLIVLWKMTPRVCRLACVLVLLMFVCRVSKILSHFSQIIWKQLNLNIKLPQVFSFVLTVVLPNACKVIDLGAICRMLITPLSRIGQHGVT